MIVQPRISGYVSPYRASPKSSPVSRGTFLLSSVAGLVPGCNYVVISNGVCTVSLLLLLPNHYWEEMFPKLIAERFEIEEKYEIKNRLGGSIPLIHGCQVKNPESLSLSFVSRFTTFFMTCGSSYPITLRFLEFTVGSAPPLSDT
jgi:hypothetical protein